MNAAVAAAGAKEAGKAIWRLFGKELSTEEWKLAGRYEAEPKGDGWYLARIDPDDPLRLEHVSGQKLVVPFKELRTDFASVPRLLQSLTGGSTVLHLQSTSYRDAALFHDSLYEAAWCWAVKQVKVVKDGREVLEARAVKVPVTKAQADAVLFVALECSGATLADGLAYHGAVTLFGGKSWRSCRNKTQEGEPLFSEGGAA